MNIRTLTVSVFILLALGMQPSSADAATCPAGTPANINGNYFLSDGVTPCSPQTVGGSAGSTGTGGTVGGSIGQTTPPGTPVTLINPLGTTCNSANTDCLGNFLSSILDFVIRIGAVVVILMLVYVGYLFVVAQGNDAKISAARNALLWTVVGALILLGAKSIQIAITATVTALSAGK